jgi:hypothetical protein
MTEAQQYLAARSDELAAEQARFDDPWGSGYDRGPDDDQDDTCTHCTAHGTACTGCPVGGPDPPPNNGPKSLLPSDDWSDFLPF